MFNLLSPNSEECPFHLGLLEATLFITAALILTPCVSYHVVIETARYISISYEVGVVADFKRGLKTKLTRKLEIPPPSSGVETRGYILSHYHLDSLF